MPIRDQDQRRVALAVTAMLGDGDRLVDLGGRQVLPRFGVGPSDWNCPILLRGATTFKCGFIGLTRTFADNTSSSDSQSSAAPRERASTALRARREPFSGTALNSTMRCLRLND